MERRCEWALTCPLPASLVCRYGRRGIPARWLCWQHATIARRATPRMKEWNQKFTVVKVLP